MSVWKIVNTVLDPLVGDALNCLHVDDITVYVCVWKFVKLKFLLSTECQIQVVNLYAQLTFNSTHDYS